MSEQFPSKKRPIHLTTVVEPTWDECLCHITSSNEKLTRFSEKSWKKFKTCSEKREDEIWLSMKNHWEKGPKGSYHRQCYQRYTNIGHLSRIKESSKGATQSSSLKSKNEHDEPLTKRVCRSQSKTFDAHKCINVKKKRLFANLMDHAKRNHLRKMSVNMEVRHSYELQG